MSTLETSHMGYGGNLLWGDGAESRLTQMQMAASKSASFPARLSSWLSAKAPSPRAESSLLPSHAAEDLVSEAIAHLPGGSTSRSSQLRCLIQRPFATGSFRSRRSASCKTW
jgi:hypothetical protein